MEYGNESSSSEITLGFTLDVLRFKSSTISLRPFVRDIFNTQNTHVIYSNQNLNEMFLCSCIIVRRYDDDDDDDDNNNTLFKSSRLKYIYKIF